jgi:hypothetical protein
LAETVVSNLLVFTESSSIQLELLYLEALQPIYIEDLKERSGTTPDASVAGTALVASSPNVIRSTEPMTPERTLSPVGLRGATSPKQMDDWEKSCLDLLGQAIDDFVNDSHEQVRQFSLPGNAPETYNWH